MAKVSQVTHAWMWVSHSLILHQSWTLINQFWLYIVWSFWIIVRNRKKVFIRSFVKLNLNSNLLITFCLKTPDMTNSVICFGIKQCDLLLHVMVLHVLDWGPRTLAESPVGILTNIYEFLESRKVAAWLNAQMFLCIYQPLHPLTLNLCISQLLILRISVMLSPTTFL